MWQSFFLRLANPSPNPPPPPSIKQTFVKIDFEISVRRTYLKKLGSRNVAEVVGVMSQENIILALVQLNPETNFILFNPRSPKLWNNIFLSSLTLDLYCCFSEV